jgi:hypothetical protein
MKKYFIFILLLLMPSCFVTRKQREKICNECKTHTEHYIRDSIYIKDTLVKIEPDSTYFEAFLFCDSMGNVFMRDLSLLQGRIVDLNFALKNNNLKVKAKTDTIKVYVKGATEVRYVSIETKVEKPVKVYKEYWWKWPLIIWSGFSAIIFTISYRSVLYSFFKIIIR